MRRWLARSRKKALRASGHAQVTRGSLALRGSDIAARDHERGARTGRQQVKVPQLRDLRRGRLGRSGRRERCAGRCGGHRAARRAAGREQSNGRKKSKTGHGNRPWRGEQRARTVARATSRPDNASDKTWGVLTLLRVAHALLPQRAARATGVTRAAKRLPSGEMGLRS